MKFKKHIFIGLLWLLYATRLSAATFTVTNTNDSGAGSLRQAVLSANGNAGADVIEFDINVVGVQTIQLNSSITISDEVFINGQSQNVNRSAALDEHLIEIVGGGTVSHCFSFSANSRNSDIFQLVINDFNFRGVDITSADQITVRGCYIGLAPSGLSVKGAFVSNGVYLFDSQNCVIGGVGAYDRNVIGNCQHGIHSLSSVSQGHLIFNCFIGVNKNGLAPLPVTNCITLTGSSRSVRIGGATSDSLNVLSGATEYGVLLQGGGVLNHHIQGNMIGIDVTGIFAIPNGRTGIFISTGAEATIVDNTISGNVNHGIYIEDNNSNAVILGNKIGVNTGGLAAVSNGVYGIEIIGDADDIIIGDGTVAGRNIISGNVGYGIRISGVLSDTNFIQGNYIGVNSTGLAKIPNLLGGIYIENSTGNIIGGASGGLRNIISGNGGDGIELNNSSGNTISGNYIGLNATGVDSIGNLDFGINIHSGSSDNMIGGAAPGEGNVISGNKLHGVMIDGASVACDNNQLIGNYIGLTSAGSLPLPNMQYGVLLIAEGSNNTIGPDNVISGNAQIGVGISESSKNFIIGNKIGTNSAGSVAIPNQQIGVSIINSDSIEIGAATGEGNVISGNGSDGLELDSSSYCLIAGNIIGLDVSGAFAIANGSDGIDIHHGCQFNQIGGTTALMRNVVSRNADDGIQIGELGSTNNVILGNYVGTDALGITGLGNQGNGVLLFNNAHNNIVGGSDVGSRNIICDNAENGIAFLSSRTDSNTVIGNFIGVNVAGNERGNSASGISLAGNRSYNAIGGNAAGEGNVISGNDGYGIYLKGENASFNQISGNYIGTDPLGMAAIANQFSGIYIDTAANNNVIGGASIAARNVISGNVANGISLVSCSENIIIGNYLGVTSDGTGALANLTGVSTENASNNQIGGGGDSLNVLSGNNEFGVWLSNSDSNVVQGNWIGLSGDGLSGVANNFDGVQILNGGRNNRIHANIIAGNGSVGTRIVGAGADNNVVSGNWYGLDTSGVNMIGGGTEIIRIQDGPSNNVIGGESVEERNVICHSVGSGVAILGLGTDNNTVVGNFIGVGLDGVTQRSNLNGVYVFNGAKNNVVGSDDSRFGNVISGNIDGILVQGGGTDSTIIKNNIIGLASDGSTTVANDKGIVIFAECEYTTVGPGNTISGNNFHGIEISDEGTDHSLVFGNTIGLDSSRLNVIGHGEVGVYIRGGSDSTIVGLPGEGNYIGGSGNSAIHVSESSSTYTFITGNVIGLTVDSANAGNRIGITINLGASDNVIGGITPDSANVISNSTEDAIQVDHSNSIHNRISGNSIYNNGGIGIDLNIDGITINDAGDGDPGPNENQNSAVLDSALLSNGEVIVYGRLSTTASQSFVVELFSSQIGDTLGAGEGQSYLDRDTVSTDASGLVSFQFDVLAQEDEQVYTVTITDLLGNTSEFSNPIEVTNPNGPGISNSGLVLWLKANEGITLSGSDVLQWDDYSGFANHAIDVAGDPPSIVNDAFNFNPIVRFDSVQQQQLRIAGGLLHSGLYSDAFVFAVAKTATVSSPIFSEATKEGGAFRHRLGQEISARYSNNPALEKVRSNPFFEGVYSGKNSVLDGARTIYENGGLLAVDMNGDTVMGDSKDFFLRGGGSSFFHGDLAELLVFTSYITETERKSIEAYLALKYGVTLDQSILRDYVIAGDTVFKAATEMISFSNDVAGIGQSDEMALFQPQSMSINNEVVVLIQTPADLNDHEFLVWGNNGMTSDSVVTGNNPSGMTHRMAREWRIQETGDVGSVSLRINVSSLVGKKSTVDDYRLMTSANPDFSGATSWVPSAVNGSTVVFDGVQLDDLNYFTVAYNQLSDPVAVDDTITVNEDTSFVDLNVLINDQDPDFNIDSTTFTILSNAANGVSTINGPGIIRYSPNLNFNGLDSVSYIICDSTALCDTGQFYITVLPINDLPIIIDDTLRINEDTVNAGISLVGNDSDIEGVIDSTTMVVLNGPYHGVYSDNGDGSIVYTPDTNYFGLDSLTYEVCDSGFPLPGACDSALLIIEISPVADSPVAIDDTVSTSQGASVVVNWIENDFDADTDIDTASFELIQSPVSGVNVIVNSGSILLEYDGQTAFFGDDSLSYRVCDLTLPTSLCDSAVIRISVIAGNAPITNTDTITLNEDTINVVINLLQNDSDPDGNLDSTSITIIKEVSNGVAVNNADGTITYSPISNFYGLDTLVYQICDSTGLCSSDTLFITVLPVSDSPVAVDDTVSLLSHCSALLIAVLDNDSDVEGDIDSTTLVLLPPFLSGANYQVIGANIQIDYAAVAGFTGPDTIRYAVCDSTVLCDTAQLVVSIAANSMPATQKDTGTVLVDSLIVLDVLDNDNDSDGIDSSSLSVVSSSLGGVVSVTDNKIRATYNISGIDTIIYEVCDSRCLCAEDTAIVAVEELLLVITLNPDEINIKSGCVEIDTNLFTNDFIPGIDSSSVVLLPPYDVFDELTLTADGELRLSFLDSSIVAGVYRVGYEVCDTAGACKQSEIEITVEQNEFPDLGDISTFVPQGEVINVALFSNSIDDEALSVNRLELLSQGALGGEFTLVEDVLVADYRLNVDSSGFDTLSFRYCDAQCACDEGRLIISVVLDPDKLMIYQGISPNGDGKNDGLIIDLAKSYPNNELQIYNRWGTLVWSASGYDNEEIIWDGKSNAEKYVVNESVALPNGTYYYIFDFGYPGFEKKTGFVVLQRE